jgi:hypothetical protein
MSDSITSLVPFTLGHGGVETIQAQVSCVEPNRLRICYLANGDMGTLKIPKKCSPRRVDRLWEHTCFEAFFRSDRVSSYYEFNFSPSGEWAAYSFRGYRDGGPIPDEGLSPEIIVHCTHDRIELDAVVRLDRLSTIRSGSTLRVGLSSVIEASDGTFSYWALKHPADKPDFHHPDSFALELPFPSQSA